jgi:cytochrome c biogenesis protein CcdA
MEPVSGILSSLSNIVGPVLGFIDAPASRLHDQQVMAFQDRAQRKAIVQQQFLVMAGLAAVVVIMFTVISVKKKK